MTVFITHRDDGKPVVVALCTERNTTVASGIPGITIESTCYEFELNKKYAGEENPECLHCIYWWGDELEEIMRTYNANCGVQQRRMNQAQPALMVEVTPQRQSRFENIIQ
jgi:hypothetical protein